MAVPEHLADCSAVRVRFASITFLRGQLACSRAGGSPARRATQVALSRVFNRQRALVTIPVTNAPGLRDKSALLI
jgi:hypothetical protein